jgi:membrane protein DedA with SNARE-associated domain
MLASAGSAMGSSALYVIGRYGGEKLLRKRISPERFAKIHASFERHEFWALMFPAMLPPPTPFKLFVLGAAVFGMQFTHFLAAIFAGRFVRFLLLSVLTIKFGPQIVELTSELVQHHIRWVAAAVVLGVAVFLLLRKRKRNPSEQMQTASGS